MFCVTTLKLKLHLFDLFNKPKLENVAINDVLPLNLIEPSVIMWLHFECSAPYRPNLPFLVFDIRALWRFNHMMTLGSKGLRPPDAMLLLTQNVFGLRDTSDVVSEVSFTFAMRCHLIRLASAP